MGLLRRSTRDIKRLGQEEMGKVKILLKVSKNTRRENTGVKRATLEKQVFLKRVGVSAASSSCRCIFLMICDGRDPLLDKCQMSSIAVLSSSLPFHTGISAGHTSLNSVWV